MRKIVFLFLVSTNVLLVFNISAQEKKISDYAVVSLIGDTLSIVDEATTADTHMNHNQHKVVPTNTTFFDDAALLAVSEAINKKQSNAKIDLLSTNSFRFYELQTKILDISENAEDKKGTLRELLKKNPSEKLILITKYRTDATITQAGRRKIGEGKLSGIGYYVNGFARGQNPATGEDVKGYIAPFVYIKISLVDSQKLTLINEKYITYSTALVGIKNEQKINELKNIFTREVSESILKLLDKSPQSMSQ